MNTAQLIPIDNRPVVPSDLEAEQAVLGAIIEDNTILLSCEKWVTPESFYKPAHQHIFRAMLELDLSQKPIDSITIGDYLKSQNHLEDCGGYAYFEELVDCVPSVGNIEYYAGIIAEHAKAREAISILTDGKRLACDPKQNIQELVEHLTSEISNLATRNDRRAGRLKDVLSHGFKVLEQRSESLGNITGTATGFTDLDNLTSGLQDTDLIIIAARPSMGKTALALNIATHAAKNSKGAILFFSLEMPKEQLGFRMLAAEGKVNTKKFLSGNLEAEDWDRLAMATEKLSPIPMIVDDTPGISIGKMRATCKYWNRTEPGGVSMVLVDYLQLMTGSKNEPREQQVAEITRTLKGIAKELNIPVIALSQLNRAVETRKDRHPQLSDLRESGSIEQDADLILFIYRDEVYNEDSADRGIAEIEIAKHRNGPQDVVRLAYIGKYTKFHNLIRRDPPPHVTSTPKQIEPTPHWQEEKD